LNYITWDSILETVNPNCDVQLSRGGHELHGGLQLPPGLPISVSEAEFNYLRQFIEENNLRSGFELATGTGISALAGGLAMKRTGGKLISFDSYIEESTGIIHVNTNANMPPYMNSLGFRISSKMLELYDCQDHVDLQCGWSPTDTTSYLEANKIRLDYVFLDCPKDMTDFRRDMNSLLPFLGDRFAIFVHDTHCYNWVEFSQYIEGILNITPVRIHEYFPGTQHHQVKHFPLARISNLK